MSIRISFPGGKRVDADLGSHVVRTDQSVTHRGTGTAPEPFELFLASLTTCAGIYVLGFCQARGMPTDDIDLVQHHHFDDTHREALTAPPDVVVAARTRGEDVTPVASRV